MLIETSDELNSLIGPYVFQDYYCILSLKDNKSEVILQHVVVKHPIDFLRNLNEFIKNLRLPVADLDIILIGFISKNLCLEAMEETAIISPYVYFKKPVEVDVSVGSDAPVPPTEA